MTSSKASSSSKGKSNLVLLVIGIFIIALLITFSIKYPDWAHENAVLSRTLLALAAAGVAALLPGFLHINVREYLKAGGALAMFALVYLINPAGERTAFDLVVNLHDKSGPQSNVLKNEGELTLSVLKKDYKAVASVDENGEAWFKNIPPENHKEKVVFSLDSRLFEIRDPSQIFLLDAEKIDLEIAPKLVKRVWGIVKSNGQFLSDAEVYIGDGTNLKAKTNSAGEFSIDIPEDLQRTEVVLTVKKTGFRYAEGIPIFQETVDAFEAEKRLEITLSKIPSTNTNQRQRERQSQTSHFEKSDISVVTLSLRYNNEIKSFDFPAQYKVLHLKNYICQSIAKEYSRSASFCELSHMGNKLNLDSKISQLNITPTTNQLSLVCNGNVVPMIRYVKFEIRGLKATRPLVFINDSYSFVELNKNGGYEGWSAVLKMNGDNNTITFDDLTTKKRVRLENIKIPSNLIGTGDNVYVFTVNHAGSTTVTTNPSN
ncbi:MAG: carboxypeptidase-like regulatory domain-containing protein [Saprospiraceae bacterium]